MADLKKLRDKVKRLTIDCGDGDEFVVLYRRDRYSWNEAIEWQRTLKNEPDEEKKTDLILEWACPPEGLIAGFENLTDDGVAVPATAEGMKTLPFAVLGLVFDSVTEALQPGKKSATP